MIKKNKFHYDDSSKGFYSVYSLGDVERVNPLEHFTKNIQFMFASQMKDSLSLMSIPVPADFQENYIDNWARDFGKLKFIQMLKSSAPLDRLYRIFVGSSKGEQIKIFKRVSLTDMELLSFICGAWEKYGFSFSHYYSSHHHNGVNENQLPKFALKKDKDIISFGNTLLTPGQIKLAIDHRKVTVSKFLDKGSEWHCFFLTYKSLKGEETAYKGGKPHLHYISHSWGLSREHVLSQLKSKNYKLPSIHIDFFTQRNE